MKQFFAGAGRARLILGQAAEGRAGAGAFAQAMRAVEAFDGFGVEVEPGTLLQDRPVPLHAIGLERGLAADRGHQGAKVQGTGG